MDIVIAENSHQKDMVTAENFHQKDMVSAENSHRMDIVNAENSLTAPRKLPLATTQVRLTPA